MTVATAPIERICRTCGIKKTLDSFGKSLAFKDGVCPYCKACLKIKRDSRATPKTTKQELSLIREYLDYCETKGLEVNETDFKIFKDNKK